MGIRNTQFADVVKRRIRKIGRKAIGFHQVFSHENAKNFQAIVESATYAEEHMKGAYSSDSKRDVLMNSLKHVPRVGLVAEFGVWSGNTINQIARAVGNGRKVHGFDSFEGLPEDWYGIYRKGYFHTGGKLPRVRSNVILHKGWFEDSLPAFVRDHNEGVAFLHVDCDLYSSTKTIFQFLGERIGTGTVILFDEYFNYPGWREHEYRAFQEFIGSRSLSYRYIAYNTTEWNAAVQIL